MSTRTERLRRMAGEIVDPGYGSVLLPVRQWLSEVVFLIAAELEAAQEINRSRPVSEV